MEIKEILKKPFTKKQELDFIVKNNHNQGYEIKETDSELQAWGYTVYELTKQERERISMLSLTAADVERAIYKAKNMDFDDLLTFIAENPPEGLDIKALKIELKANNFYRGNPYIDMVGGLLGYNQEELDYLFENGCFKEKEVDINAGMV